MISHQNWLVVFVVLKEEYMPRILCQDIDQMGSSAAVEITLKVYISLSVATKTDDGLGSSKSKSESILQES